MKYILILGAGLMQRPAILAGKKLGLRTVVVDGNPSAVCVPLADEFRPVDLKDREAIAALALELKRAGGLAAVFTAGTDFSASVAFASEKCGLPGHSYESALNASDKTRMRACFSKAGVPSPPYRRITADTVTAELTEERIRTLVFPLVVKPVDNMGARGCRMIRCREEIVPAVKAAIANSRTGSAILEDYMDGPEYSIDAVVYDGTMTVTGFADRHIFYPPYFIETGHTMPTVIDQKHRNELIATFALGVNALGLSRGAVKADIKYTSEGPMIGEIAARLSGGYMSGWTFPYASDCNLTEQTLLVSCGQIPDVLEKYRREIPFTPPELCASSNAPFRLYDLPCVRSSAERAWISIPGTVREIIGLQNAEREPYVRDVLPRSEPGNTVVFPRNNVEKCGNVITAAPSTRKAVDAAENAVRCITVRLESPNEATEEFITGCTCSSESGFPPSAFVLDDRNLQQFAEFEKSAGTVSADTPLLPLLPDCLKSVADSGLRDWNYCTILTVLEHFDRICPKHKEFDAARFWRALIRGGIQGALYVSDCA